MENDKPSVKFTEAIHTPIVRSASDHYRYLDIEPTMPIKERIEIVDFYLPLLDRLLRNVKFGKEVKGYEKIIQEGGVPEKYLFKLSEIKSAVVIGKFPKPEELPETLKNRIWQE